MTFSFKFGNLNQVHTYNIPSHFKFWFTYFCASIGNAPLPDRTLIFCPGGSGSGPQGVAQAGSGTGGVGGNLTTQAAFEYRGTWIPLMTVSVQGSAKAT